MFLGAHMSIAGGLHMAFKHIQAVNGTALQIFTRNQRQWKIPPLSDYTTQIFKLAWEEWGEYPVAAHDSYLINLASHKEEQADKSRISFAEELRRIEALGIAFLVTHPGSHLGQGAQEGITRYVSNLDRAIEESQTNQGMVLLETTAGQGSNLGSTFEELATILEMTSYPERLGVCYDTCHTFAAGYDIRTFETYTRTFEEFDRIIGLEHLKFFHLNDSKNSFASNKDRHEHIGQGTIGIEGFQHLMNDDRFKNVPKILETPKENDLVEDRHNLTLLRQLQEHQ